jgi:hypothetical protein
MLGFASETESAESRCQQIQRDPEPGVGIIELQCGEYNEEDTPSQVEDAHER